MNNKQEMLRDYYKMSPNFMTPNISKYEIVGNRLVEFSSGTGFDDKTIYGVTEMIWEDGKWQTTRNSNMFRMKRHALRYYEHLLN